MDWEGACEEADKAAVVPCRAMSEPGAQTEKSVLLILTVFIYLFILIYFLN